MTMTDEEIARARKGKTKARRLQCYVNDKLYDWFSEFREAHGLNESQAVKLCLRHVMVEHRMQDRGKRHALKSHEIDIDKIAALRGSRPEG
ncbi:MAG: hypothetical protein WC083_04645 [Candidatus Methanomethylophilaceae archaeon]